MSGRSRSRKIARIVPMCSSMPTYFSARSEMMHTVEPPQPAILGVWRTPNVPSGMFMYTCDPGVSAQRVPSRVVAMAGVCSRYKPKLAANFCGVLRHARSGSAVDGASRAGGGRRRRNAGPVAWLDLHEPSTR